MAETKNLSLNHFAVAAPHYAELQSANRGLKARILQPSSGDFGGQTWVKMSEMS
jgi:hypothetical protein